MKKKMKLFFLKPFCCEITNLLNYLLYAPSFSGWGSELSRICTGRRKGGQAGPGGSYYPLRTFFSPFFFVLGVEQEQKNSHVAVSHQYVQTREREIAFARKKSICRSNVYIPYILWYICSISLSLSHIPLSPTPPPPFLLLTKQSSQPNSSDTSSQETSSPHPTTKYSFHTPWEKTNTRPE